MFEAMADCAVKRNSKRASKAMNLSGNTKENADFVESMIDDNDHCIAGGTIQFPTKLLRGYVFRSLYARYYVKRAPVIIRR